MLETSGTTQEQNTRATGDNRPGKGKRYSEEFKTQVLIAARDNGVATAARLFHVNESLVYGWRKDAGQVRKADAGQARKTTQARKPAGQASNTQDEVLLSNELLRIERDFWRAKFYETRLS